MWIETTPGIGRIIEVTSSSRWASLLPTTSARMSKPTRGDHHVVDLLDRRELLGHRLQGSLDDDADHRLAREPELERIGHGDDLHHVGLDQLRDTLANVVLGEAQRLTDDGVGTAAVLLELFDDRLGVRVDLHPGGPAWGSRGSQALAVRAPLALDHSASPPRACLGAKDTGSDGSRTDSGQRSGTRAVVSGHPSPGRQPGDPALSAGPRLFRVCHRRRTQPSLIPSRAAVLAPTYDSGG